MSCLPYSFTSSTNGLTLYFQVLVTSALRSEIRKLRKSDTFCQIVKKVSENKLKNRQIELSSKKGERNRMMGRKIWTNMQNRKI